MPSSSFYRLAGALLAGVTSFNSRTGAVVPAANDYTMADITGLVAALAAKADLASPALTGTPTAPTAGVTVDTTQIATTAFVQDVVGTDAVTLTDGASVALDASLGTVFDLTAAGDRTVSVPTNKPASGKTKKIVIRHKASGGSRTLSLTTGSAGAFRYGTDITGLTATTSGKTDMIGCIYNAADDRWDVVAYAKGF